MSSDSDVAMRATLDYSGVSQGFDSIISQSGRLQSSVGSGMSGLKLIGAEVGQSLAGSFGMVASPAGLAVAGIAGVGAALSSSVNVAGNFQQKMAGVNAIVGGSASDMQTLSNAAREAGASTSFSASQAADALGFMAGAGWNVTQSTAALKDTLTLASAGGMDLAQAGDLMTNTVSQFGLAATDSARVANVLAAGASATNTNVSQLGEGMKVVGATANAFGMSLESTTAALGSLSNAGIKGAEGGTALRGIIASLATQSGPAAKALAEIGVSAEEINPATVSVADAMQLLQERGMTATQAIAIFGRENVSAATYLAAHASSLDGLQTSITGTGKASEMAATMTDTYQGAMGELSSAAEEAQIALGTALLPVVTDTVQLFTAGITAATDFGKSISDTYTDFQTGTVADSDKSFLGWLGVNTDTAKAAGDSAAKDVAAGVTENKDLQDATGKTLGSDASKKAVAKSADDLAKEFTKQYGSQFEAGMTLINGKWTSQAAAVADRITEKTVMRNDIEYTLRSINSGENMIYEVREKSTGELIKQSEQLRQTNSLLTSMQWATSEGYSDIQRTITFDFIVNRSTAIDSAMKELGESAANSMKNGIIDATEQQTLTELAAKFVSMGGDASDALISAIQRKDWGAVGRMAGEKVGKSFAESLGLQMKNALDDFDWSKLATTPMSEMFPGSGKDFAANAFGPEFLKNAQEELDLWNTGVIANREEVKKNMDVYEKIAQINPWVLGGNPEYLLTLTQLTNGLIDEGQALNRIVNSSEKAKKETKQFKEEVGETCDACVNLLSLFDAWQESTPELFHPSYIGPSWGDEYEDAMAAMAASNRLMQLNNDRYAQAKQGTVTERTDEIRAMEDILTAYHAGTMTSKEHALAVQYLGANYDIAKEQVAEFATEIEGINLKFDDMPKGADQWIQFKEENKQDITPTLGLNTDPALNDFLAFKAVIEGETIATRLKIDDPTKTKATVPKAGTFQDDTSTSMRLSAIQLAIGTNANNIVRTISATGVSTAAQMRTAASGVSSTVSGSAGSIVTAINAAAMEIVSAINGLDSGGAEGASGISGSSGSALSYASMDMPVYTGGPFAEGGYVDRPTWGLFGEAGPEYIVPESDMNQILGMSAIHNLSIAANIDSSGLQSQIRSVVESVASTPLIIPVAFDSEGMKETLTSILYELLHEVRL
jgi:TP901 family phage tail tape measure protein